MARDRGDLDVVEKLDKELMYLRVKSWIFNPELHKRFLEDYFQDPPPDRNVNKWIWEAAESWFSWDRLKEVQIPLWLCVGANDAVPIDQGKKVAEMTSNAQLTVLEKCGHIPWLEHTATFYSQLKGFLEAPPLKCRIL